MDQSDKTGFLLPFQRPDSAGEQNTRYARSDSEPRHDADEDRTVTMDGN